MSDEAPRKSGKPWFWAATVLCSVLVLYVASIGPAAILAERKLVPEPPLEMVYAPLLWVVEKADAEDALEAYVKVWGRLTNTPIP